MKKAVFFDIYGTLIDIITDEHDPWVYATLSKYLTYHQINITPDALKTAYFHEVEKYVKQSTEAYPEVDIYWVFHRIMHKYGPKVHPKRVVTDTAMLFRSLTRKHFEVFPSLYEVLDRLRKKYKIAIISDAQWVFTEPEIAMLGLDQYFRIKILSSCFGFKKPEKKLFILAANRFGARPEECVYIGDNPRKDLVGAKRAGMRCILFRSGGLEYDDFKADACFHHYSELEKILRDML